MFLRKILKVINSRYFISSLFIVFELVILFLLQKYLNDYLLIFYVFSFIFSLLAFLYVVNSNTIPETKMPWMLIILVFQPFGAILFFIFGSRQLTLKEKRYLRSLNKEQKMLTNNTLDNLKILKEHNIEAYQFANALCFESFSTMSINTNVKYFKCGEDFYIDFIEELKNAEKFIFMEYFIIEECTMWNEILSILRTKVNDGVEVRLLYDDIGSLFSIPINYYKKLRQYGIKANCFSKFNGRANSSHNNRSHRKITVIDGKIAFTGGINLADEYINRNDRLGYWKDSAIKLRGSGVDELTKTFLFDWDLNDNKKTKYDDYLNLYENCIQDGFIVPFSTGPVPLYNPDIAKNMYLNLINNARSFIYLTTPYLIIDNELTNSLMNASKRGVEVVIITPHIPDKKFVYELTKSSYKQLMNSGVKIYEFTPGFIHAKNFIVDGKYAVCGTINFDYRSLIHHYENAVWMFENSSIESMTNDFIETVDKSIIQTEQSIYQRPIIKLLVGIIKIFAPFF